MAQNHCGENTLFLYDEPDVHFNDEWSRDFVRFVYAMCSMDGKSGNEFLIATHSDLILTDAMWEQIHLFENPTGSKTEVKDLEISTFAAGRDSISRQVFKASAIGRFAVGFCESIYGKKKIRISWKRSFQKWVPVISVSVCRNSCMRCWKKGIRYRRRHF